MGLDGAMGDLTETSSARAFDLQAGMRPAALSSLAKRSTPPATTVTYGRAGPPC